MGRGASGTGGWAFRSASAAAARRLGFLVTKDNKRSVSAFPCARNWIVLESFPRRIENVLLLPLLLPLVRNDLNIPIRRGCSEPCRICRRSSASLEARYGFAERATGGIGPEFPAKRSLRTYCWFRESHSGQNFPLFERISGSFTLASLVLG